MVIKLLKLMTWLHHHKRPFGKYSNISQYNVIYLVITELEYLQDYITLNNSTNFFLL